MAKAVLDEIKKLAEQDLTKLHRVPLKECYNG